MIYEPLDRAMKNQILEQGSNGIYFFNFSLPAIVTCPSAVKACTDICFAKKFENRYSIDSKNNGASEKKHYKNLLVTLNNNLHCFDNFISVHLANLQHMKEIKSYIDSQYQNIYNYVNSNVNPQIKNNDLFIRFMISYINKKFQNLKIKHQNEDIKMYIRIHYSGDFYNDEYFKKWVEITNYFSKPEYKNIHFMAYTKEITMIYNFVKSKKSSKNNKPLLNAINMKIVFSEMANSKNPSENTSSRDLTDFQNLQKLNGNTTNDNNLIKYTVYNKGNFQNKKTSFQQNHNSVICGLPDGKKCAQCLHCYIKNTVEDVVTTVL